MPHNPQYPSRRSIRLPGYDYSQPGAYFVTIATSGRECLFGEILDHEMQSSRFGEIVRSAWLDLPNHYRYVILDEYAIMPDHVHGILILDDGPLPRHGLPEIVRAFKSFSAKRINFIRGAPQTPVWQRSYYEHIIRNDAEWDTIRCYIQANPFNWEYNRDNETQTEYYP